MEKEHTIIDDLRAKQLIGCLDMYNERTISEFQNKYFNGNKREKESGEDREQVGKKG